MTRALARDFKHVRHPHSYQGDEIEDQIDFGRYVHALVHKMVGERSRMMQAEIVRLIHVNGDAVRRSYEQNFSLAEAAYQVYFFDDIGEGSSDPRVDAALAAFNPLMHPGVKWGLIGAAALGLGVGAYFLFRKKEDKSPVQAPNTIQQGHRYQVTFTGPMSFFNKAQIPANFSAADLQKTVDDNRLPIKVVSFNMTRAADGSGKIVVVFDWTGANTTEPVPADVQAAAAAAGVSITMADLGPYKTAGVAGAYRPRTMAPVIVHRLFIAVPK